MSTAEQVNTPPPLLSAEASPTRITLASQGGSSINSSQGEKAASQRSGGNGELTVVTVEPEKHPKNRRKRTQAHDKAILESAYQANPKPDKAARQDIVNRVSLSEKEVQIWFQNRRQNDRRKARPLSPQEIAAFQSGGMQIVSPTGTATSSLVNVNGGAASRLCGASTSPLAGKTIKISPSLPLLGSPHRPEIHHHHPQQQADYHNSSDSPSHSQSDQESRGLKVSDLTSSPESASHSPVMPQSFPSSSNSFQAPPRWSFATLASPEQGDQHENQKTDVFSSSCSSTVSDTGGVVAPRPRPSHKVRLSFSLEGKAEVVSNEPSPPRAQPERPLSTLPQLPLFRPRTLQRSQSALSGVTLPPISALTGSLPPSAGVSAAPSASSSSSAAVSAAGRLLLGGSGRASGRSHNVHAWELCCDETAPDDLTKLAENESNGSALAAIKLLRSASSSSSATTPTGGSRNSTVLQPSGSAKRNAAVSKQGPRPHNAKKARLAKSLSMSGLPLVSWSSDKQTTVAATPVFEDDEEEAHCSKKLKVSMLVSPGGGDSDKENWSPDEEGNPVPSSRPATVAVAGSGGGRRTGDERVLQEQPTRATLAGMRANTAPLFPSLTARRSPTKKSGSGGGGGVRIYEDGRVFDQEVEKFMRGEVSPSKRGDADCVAGLIALSQGNWR